MWDAFTLYKYSKSGGKNGKAAISYMVVQIFEPILRSTVETLKADRLSLLQVKEYALVTSNQFLNEKPTLNPTGLRLASADSLIVSSLYQWSAEARKAKKRERTNKIV